MRASAFIATSIDGYIARSNYSIDWLEEASAGETQDFGYENFIRSVSVIVMGRKTFQKVLTFPEWPYYSMRVIVMSSTFKEVPEALENTVQLFGGTVEELHYLLESEGEQHVYIDGSRVIQSYIKAGLLTDITLTTIPILIGDGIRLFGPIDQDIKMAHHETRAFQNGFVQTSYLFQYADDKTD